MPSSNLRPLDDNFEDDSGRLYRQTIMFSATMPFKVEQLAKNYLRNPVRVRWFMITINFSDPVCIHQCAH
jgi:ATP-dependent RNA helicase DDX23/PRP28